jgi:hypothetical protein
MNTYAELQSFVADFLARDDLTTQIRTFVRLAEQRMSRELDIALLETTTQLAVTANATTTALPTDLRSIREVAKIDADGTRTNLSYLTPAQYDVRIRDAGQTQTEFYTIVANNIKLAAVPSADLTLELIYNEGVAQLSDTATSNTLLTRHGDCYLHGTLKQAFDFLQDEQRSAYHDAQFTRCLAEIDRDSDKQRYGNADLQVRRRNEQAVF